MLYVNVSVHWKCTTIPHTILHDAIGDNYATGRFPHPTPPPPAPPPMKLLPHPTPPRHPQKFHSQIYPTPLRPATHNNFTHNFTRRDRGKLSHHMFGPSASKYDGALHSDCDVIATHDHHGEEQAIKLPTLLLRAKIAPQAHPAHVAGAEGFYNKRIARHA